MEPAKNVESSGIVAIYQSDHGSVHFRQQGTWLIAEKVFAGRPPIIYQVDKSLRDIKAIPMSIRDDPVISVQWLIQHKHRVKFDPLQFGPGVITFHASSPMEARVQHTTAQKLIENQSQQRDQEGDYYRQLLEARREGNFRDQCLWLEKLGDLYLAKGDLNKAAHLLNGACALSQENDKLRLFNKLGAIEEQFLRTAGVTQQSDSSFRIQNQRLYLENYRRQFRQKFSEIDPDILSIQFRQFQEFLFPPITVSNKILFGEIVTTAISYLGPPPCV